MKTEAIPIIGMHCASCKLLIEKKVSRLLGVNTANANFATEELTVTYDPAQVGIDQIGKAVESAGDYKLNLHKAELQHNEHAGHSPAQHEHAVTQSKLIFWVAQATSPFFAWMIIMFLQSVGVVKEAHSLLGYITLEPQGYKWNVIYIIQFLLATPIVFIGGKSFFTSAFQALKARTTNMDTLVAIGIFTAWAFSTYITFIPRALGTLQAEVYFEAAAIITFFVLLGRFLETQAKGSARRAIAKLAELQAKQAIVIEGKKEVLKKITEVKVGDLVLVKPGEKVPVDGKVTKGESSVDESLVTGESELALKKVGDTVIGSTINTSGVLYIEVTKVGEQTLLSQITHLVHLAQGSQPPIQKLADRVSEIFVPIVVMIALAALVFWLVIAPGFGIIPSTLAPQFAIYIFTTVLIIACPCALGLATPVAVMVGSGLAARKGILIKDSKALELMHKAKYIVFDKTGTLTYGRPVVVHSTYYNDDLAAQANAGQAQTFTYSMERLSSHPIAGALVEYLHDIEMEEVEGFTNIEGRGVQGKIAGKEVKVGKLNWLEVKLTAEQKELVESWHQEAFTIVGTTVDEKLVALFALQDEIKPAAKALISELKQMHIEPILLTGDSASVAKALAAELNISEVISQVLPTEKADKIRELKSQHPNEIIVMVGDGINDAPALALADVGIAMGNGTEIAMEAGSVVLIGGDIAKVAETIQISRRTLRIIKQNLFWAFGYNIVAIPIAIGTFYPLTGVLLSPIIASATMAFSSISVVLNSLRVRRG